MSRCIIRFHNLGINNVTHQKRLLSVEQLRVRNLSQVFHPQRVSTKFPSLGQLTGIQRVQPGDTIWVAMSGGVDSSTVAGLLSQKVGKDRVKGVFMNNWTSTSRCQETNWKTVQEVCKVLNIECTHVNLESNYWTEVFEPMLQAYQQGSTPNPDVSCNQFIKFGKLITKLRNRDSNFKWLATGHYAGLSITDQGSFISRPHYKPKDQSYYLSTVSPSTLDSVLFPLAELEKPQVRQLAVKLGLVTVAQKPDSQGLCFVEQQQEIGNKRFHKFLSEYIEDSPGPVVLQNDLEKVVGEHRGLWTYTIGQRVGVAMPQNRMPGKWFVTGKDKARNAIIIDRGSNSDALFVNRVISKDFKWHRAPRGDNLYVQYRSLQEPWRLHLWKASKDVEFYFKDCRRAVSPGQFIVVYEEDVVIGSGTISETGRQ